MTGTIKRLVKDKGFGFIGDTQGQEYFFHRSDVRGTPFEALGEGDSVEFEGRPTPKGLRADWVRVEE